MLGFNYFRTQGFSPRTELISSSYCWICCSRWLVHLKSRPTFEKFTTKHFIDLTVSNPEILTS